MKGFNSITCTGLSLVAVFLLNGCAREGTVSASAASAVSTSTGTSTGAAAISVAQYSPAAGTVTSLPTSIAVTFSESSLVTGTGVTSVTNAANYFISCGTQIYYATGVSYNGTGTATVTMPVISTSAGAACTFNVAQSILDTSGNYVMASQSVAYTVSSSSVTTTTSTGTTTSTSTSTSTSTGSGSLSISSFSPATSSVASMPTSVQILFSETSLDTSSDAYSVLNLANYSMVCNGTNYAATSVSMVAAGTVQVVLPSVTIASGATCVLTASSNLADANGNLLSGVAQATYTQAHSTAATWTESSNATLTADSGTDLAGYDFYDQAGSGLLMRGLTISSGLYIDNINGIWTNGFANVNSIYGPSHGGTGGHSNGDIVCPANMRVTGVSGTYSSQINSLSISCSSVDGSQTYQSSVYGQATANTFSVSCPAGQFATDLAGSANHYVNSIQLGCR